jgi:biofilm PGA synthesis lipoprotein PgaB
MLRFFASLVLMLAVGFAHGADSFIVLAYHDVQDQVAGDAGTTVSTANLEAQFAWLRRNGYRVVSVQDLLDAKSGKKKLPEKAVLLSFDDGYLSFYQKVFPLLKRYRYPALTALVGSWMEVGAGALVPYGERDPWPRERFLAWKQVKEMVRSGLVEVASHSHDSHHGLPGNPQGNTQPVAVTRIYDAEHRVYENDEAYGKRIREEIRRSSDDLFRRLGVRPRVMVWPYGEFNQPLVETARAAGMPITMGLVDGHNSLDDLAAVKRLLIVDDPGLEDFATVVTRARADPPVRVAHVDLDYIYDPDPKQTELNLLSLMNRVLAMGINTVYLQAYADPDGDGNAEALYFPNRHLPMRADLFNRAAWQLRTKARAKVYAWMPVLAFRIEAPEDWFVYEWRNGKAQPSRHIYKRLSPFNADARRVIGEIYEDLAKHCHFSGLLFHDDALLSDYEDLSPAGLADLQASPDLPKAFETLHGSPETRLKWAQRKTQRLIDLTDFLADKVRYHRPYIKTARNLYAEPLLRPFAEEWYAQSFPAFLAHYDYVAIEAMPLMEKAENPDAWLADLVRKVAAHPDGLRKTVFELQSVDWNSQSAVSMDFFLKQIRLVQSLGAWHFGYYPDNMIRDYPRLADMRDIMAAPRFP